MTKPHYQFTTQEVQQQFGTSAQGLTDAEVEKRRLEFGLNQIPEAKQKTFFRIFLNQFLSPLIYILLAAAFISVLAQDIADAGFILAIILINAGLGAWQESKAEHNASALRSMVKVKARVRRNGQLQEIEADELVPGDFVLLESGVRVPCDIRLLNVNDLAVEEALLTGESLAVQKSTAALEGNVHSIGDRVNMAFAGTTVLKGRATGVATGTGIHTEIGKIADSLATSEPEQPPLIRRMEAFAKTISKVVLVVCVLLGMVGSWRGMELMEIIFFMIAVAVSAIPEGLPVALTVVLSIGTSRMAKKNVIVRKLPAVEGLGSCTMIASDKTGTLTMDEQSVRRLVLSNGRQVEVTGQGYNGEGTIKLGESAVDPKDPALYALLQAGVLCNEGSLHQTDQGWQHSGDAVDVALHALAFKSGQSPVFFQTGTVVKKMVPYESENKFSGVFYEVNGQLHFAMKGAVEVIALKLPVEERLRLYNLSDSLATQGFRVIALASGPVNNTELEELRPLSLQGIVGLIDPLRKEVIQAIKDCQSAGIEVAMVTGDHPATALAIARQLGLAASEEEVISGQELAAISAEDPESFRHQIVGKHVFARVSPLQKKEIVEAMKANGHYVAVTGDGANDAPALKAAHIGIAMGSGTDLAKDTSSIIITDNNFASIAAGVNQGRHTYSNLRNIIYLLISTGAAELGLVAITLMLALQLPFIAVQLLWLNLVTNGIQHVALAFEKGDPDSMKAKPRNPEDGIFDRYMNQQLFVSAATIISITLVLWVLLTEVQGMEIKHARSVLIMLMVLLQNFHVLNCRSETKSLFQMPLKNNYFLLMAIVGAQLVHVGASYIPFLASILQLEPVLFEEWIKLLPTAAIVLVVMEFFKWFKRWQVATSTSMPDFFLGGKRAIPEV